MASKSIRLKMFVRWKKNVTVLLIEPHSQTADTLFKPFLLWM